MTTPDPLTPAAFRWTCDPASLGFATTDDLEPVRGVVGQDHAVEALRFGLEIDAPGQNVFVRGLVGTGRLTLVRDHLTTLDTPRPKACDQLYAHNFDAPDRPARIAVPRGSGRALAEAVRMLCAFIRDDLSSVVTTDAMADQRKAVQARVDAEVGALRQPLEAKLSAQGLALGFQQRENAPPLPVLLPLVDGKPATPDQVKAAVDAGQLTDERMKALQEVARQLSPEVGQFTARATAIAARHRASLGDAVRHAARAALDEVARPIRDAHPQAGAHLDRVIADCVDNRLSRLDEPAFLRLYELNPIAVHDEDGARPVIVENAPSVQSLLGAIDPAPGPDGQLRADHMALHAGALLTADGGTLVVDARDLAQTPGAWKALTRTLRTGHVELTPGDTSPSTLRPPSLKPEPLPVNVKVVLLGDHGVYRALDQQDPEFKHLFKVLVDFDDMLPRTPESVQLFARVLARIVQRDGLPPLTAGAVARLIEHSSRIAARPDRLTARFGRVVDLAREAVWLARRRSADTVSGDDVVQAIARTKFRAGQAGRSFRDRVLRGVLRIQTTGRVVGQINGLAVTQAGQLTYGFPTRITATVAPGTDGTLDVESAAQLSGQIHTKGFHILTGLLRTLLRPDHPLAFAASIAFEQSYGGIDGDSASGAEACCLLSAIARVPIDQSIAMTGAVDQHGHVQAVGAVNEKIEGFFDTCVATGLSGTQGCILPLANAGDLNLRQDVVDAARAGQFRIWAVDELQDALALLTGRDPDDVLQTAREGAKRLYHLGRPRD